ncbi:hypothetical protein SY88_01000 [Clostridiales bacterium PH28_bin88]|nr:hypothetical protein SY88_01000 [Clostridiales bacterium PH28_bin88]
MLRSMTGYGRGEAMGGGKAVSVEIKSVNHRFLEISVRMPRTYVSLEERVRRVIKDQITRGHIDVFCNIEDEGEKKRQVKVDKDLALAYHHSLRELAQILGITGNFGVMDIAQFPDVLKVDVAEEDLEAFWPVLEAAVKEGVQNLVKMRRDEGARLKADLLERCDLIARETREIAARAPVVIEEYRQKLAARVKEWESDLGGEVDPMRVATEVAFFSDRSNITEELVRLNSHLEQLSDTLNTGEAVGRKLDFLIQEMNREINTVGSKASDLEISQKVVAIKSEIEKVREQVQNIE